MSAQRSAWVECDDCGAQLPGDMSARTVREARAEARSDGWAVSLPGGRDLCDECRPASTPTDPENDR